MANLKDEDVYDAMYGYTLIAYENQPLQLRALVVRARLGAGQEGCELGRWRRVAAAAAAEGED